MGESVTILYRGARYEIGLVRRCYAIWAAGDHQSPPLEWWPETSEGWSDAWSRFSGLEPGGGIVQVDPYAPAAPVTPAVATALAAPAAPAVPGGQAEPATAPDFQADPATGPGGFAVQPAAAAVAARTGRSGVTGAALLALGVLCGFIGLFPAYVAGASLASASANLVPHLFYLVSWIIGAGLIMLGGTRMRVGALLALGTSAVTLGFFLADVGEAADSSSGAGLALSVAGWAVCTAGAVVAMRGRRAGLPGGVRGAEMVTLVLALLAGLGVAAAFAPAWDSYTGQTIIGGLTRTVTLGNAFDNPGLVITGDIMVMIAVVAAAVAAALWRPVRLGAALLAGAIVPMLAQAISAMIGIGQTSPALFGLSPAQGRQFGLTISSSLTAAFWIYCVFLVALLLACALLLVSHDRTAPTAAQARPSSAQPPGPQPPGAQGFGGPGLGGQVPGVPAPGTQPVTPALAPMNQAGPTGYADFPSASPSGAASPSGLVPAPGPAPAPGAMPTSAMPTSAESGGIPGPSAPGEPGTSWPRPS